MPKESPTRNPNRLDRRRWFMFAGQNMPVEAIAEREGKSVDAIQKSIDIVQEYRFRHSNEMVALAVNEEFIKQVPSMGQVFGQGLKAQKYLPTGKGKFKAVPDVGMRLKTVETIKSLQEVAQPKVPLVQNNNQINNNINNPGYQPGMSFEARLRLVRERRGMKNEDEVVTLDAAEADVDQTLEEEMEDMDIDLGDDEGDDEASS